MMGRKAMMEIGGSFGYMWEEKYLREIREERPTPVIMGRKASGD